MWFLNDAGVQGALYGTLFSWGLTAAGAATVFLVPRSLPEKTERQVLDFAFGFAGGVMLAASFWSLLDPAIELASENPMYGERWAFIPAAVGFLLGGLTIFLCDQLAENFGLDHMDLMVQVRSPRDSDSAISKKFDSPNATELAKVEAKQKKETMKRLLLLVAAITIHNFPEGIAIGVAFGSAGTLGTEAAFARAWTVALGIGIQNLPEGLAVSLPMYRSGTTRLKSFWYGQLSGAVEPFGGLLGAIAVQLAVPILPYALAFAAGAMIYVVVEDLLVEAYSSGNSKLCSAGLMVGFVVMMSLDVALG
jgi:zinc transporter 11